MLTSITIKDFRTFKDVTIPLKPLTVFIGPNNSGKTNAIRAIQLLATAARTGTWPDGKGGPRVDMVEESPFALEATGVFEKTVLKLLLNAPTGEEFRGTASLELSGDVGWRPTFSNSMLESQGPRGQFFRSRDAPEFLRNSLKIAEDFSAGMTRAVAYFQGARIASLSVPKLREPAPISKDPILGERGENFGAVLDWVSGKHPALFRSINDELHRVLGLDGCTTLVTEAGMKIPAIIEGERSFPADVISDGILLYMGLTTVAHLVGPRSLLIIEEPENGIHPRRLKALLEQIRGIGRRGTQVILTTHSPILLDEFSDEPQSIVIFDRDSTGTHVSQPAAEQIKEVLNGNFGLGSLWFSGAIGGVPA